MLFNWHPSISVKQGNDIESIQKRACRTILGGDFTSYNEALVSCGLDSLLERKVAHCHRFAEGLPGNDISASSNWGLLSSVMPLFYITFWLRDFYFVKIAVCPQSNRLSSIMFSRVPLHFSNILVYSIVLVIVEHGTFVKKHTQICTPGFILLGLKFILSLVCMQIRSLIFRNMEIYVS